MVFVLRAVASFAILAAASAIAADRAPDRLLEGTLAISGAAGHDCLPTSRELRVELLLDAPTERFALLGFDDGHTVRWTYANGTLASAEDAPAVALQRVRSGDGAEIAMIAPGTETCRWTATLRIRDSQAVDRVERAARLVARDAANAVFAEGDALLAQGKAADALPVYERAVAQRKTVLGDEHPLSLRGEIRVVRALHLDGKPDVARERVERVLAIQRASLGENASDTLKSRIALGTMLWAAGRPQDALPILQQVYDTLRERYGARHLDTLVAQQNLGLILWDLGRLAEAAAHYENLLPATIAIRGETHPRSLDAMNNLGLIYQGLGRHAAALELLERAYRLGVASVGAEHPDSLNTLQSVAVGYAQLDRMEDALALYQVAHAGLRKAVGDDHSWTLTAQSNIAASLFDLQRVDEARAIAVDLVPRAERAMGPTHVYTLRWSGMLGAAYYQSGDYAAAETQYARVLAQQRTELGAEHPDTLESMANLAQARFANGDRVRGAAELQRAYDDLRRINGPSHRVTLTAIVALAEVAAAQGDRQKAIALLDELVAAVEKLRTDEGLARETRQSFFARWSMGYKRLAVLHGANDPAAAFRIAELSKARTLLESLALRSADMAGIIGPEDAARLGSLDAQVSALSHAIASAGGRGDEAFKLESERNALTRESAAFRRDLRARYPRYAELAEVELIDAERASALARPGEALISYLVAGDEAIAFVVRRGRPLAVVPLGLVGALDRTRRSVSDAAGRIADRRATARLAPARRQLRRIARPSRRSGNARARCASRRTSAGGAAHRAAGARARRRQTLDHLAGRRRSPRCRSKRCRAEAGRSSSARP